MLNKEDAIVIRDRAVTAIRELMTLLYFAEQKASDEESYQIKRGVGIAVGRIQVDILDAVINKAYPEFDDLVGTDSETKH